MKKSNPAETEAAVFPVRPEASVLMKATITKSRVLPTTSCPSSHTYAHGSALMAAAIAAKSAEDTVATISVFGLARL